MSNIARKVYDFLVTRDLEPEILDRAGKTVLDPSEAEIFNFKWQGPSGRQYGNVVILLNPEVGLEVYAADNLGRTMEPEDKDAWFGTGTSDGFLPALKNMAVTSVGNMGFGVQNINRLKYTMQGMAAIREGLFEGYYGRGRRTSYSDQPRQTRLMIRHNRDLGEGEARYRAIESLYVETADGERFRVPSRNLGHGRMLARHIAEGGNPYDAFGQHINDMVQEIGVLGRFIRLQPRDQNSQASRMREGAVRHYQDLKAKAKRMISRRGYHEARDTFDPTRIADSEHMVDHIREMFQENTLDPRIEAALPVLARISAPVMAEAQEFEAWSHSIVEGTWALPDSPSAQREIRELMSKPLPVGVDAINATEQVYDLLGDDELFDILSELAQQDPDADIWQDDRVIARMQELGVDVEQPESPELQQDQAPDQDLEPSAQDTAAPQPEPPRVPVQQDQAGMAEDLDTDGVMMTKASNMSSESRDHSVDLSRLVELAMGRRQI